jgi:predicted O-methyltransferase YrrM
MPTAGWIVAGIAVILWLFELWRRLRARAERKQRGVFGAWPIPTCQPWEVDPVFTPGPLGPTLATEVRFVGRGPMVVPGGTSDAEAWILSVLATRRRHFFEFGTCTGKTAYLLARNGLPDARVVTLTLAPTQRQSYEDAAGDSRKEKRFALAESAFTEFLYSGTDVEDRIEQLYGDSKHLDETPWLGWADLVFVDGSHARSYVESDSQKAMRIVRPGGLVLWHDYAGSRHAPGVFRALNELHGRAALRHIAGTTLVVWQRDEG